MQTRGQTRGRLEADYTKYVSNGPQVNNRVGPGIAGTIAPHTVGVIRSDPFTIPHSPRPRESLVLMCSLPPHRHSYRIYPQPARSLNRCEACPNQDAFMHLMVHGCGAPLQQGRIRSPHAAKFQSKRNSQSSHSRAKCNFPFPGSSFLPFAFRAPLPLFSVEGAVSQGGFKNKIAVPP